MSALPVSYPLSGPTVSGDNITLDMLLNQPTRITAYLSDLTLRGMFSQRVFSNGGGLTGGALIYDQLTSNQLFTNRDVQEISPGAEFPIVTADRLTSKVAVPVKIGGKYFVTDEARDRNDASTVQLESQLLANTIQRKLDTTAIALLDAALTEFSRTTAGVNWATAKTTASGSVTKGGSPVADFAKIQGLADVDELGVRYNLWLVNPAQYTDFLTFYGAENLAAVLNASGIEMVSTNRVTAGTAYALQAGAVGQMRLEKPLSTVTYREEATERTWVQSGVRVAMAVTNPYSAIKVTGLAG
jgi:hypothetical protein